MTREEYEDLYAEALRWLARLDRPEQHVILVTPTRHRPPIISGP